MAKNGDPRKDLAGRVESPDGIRLKFGRIVLGNRKQQRYGQPFVVSPDSQPVKTAGKPLMKKG